MLCFNSDILRTAYLILSFKNDYTTNTNDYDTKKITHAYTRYIGFAYLGPRKIVQKSSFNTQAIPKE